MAVNLTSVLETAEAGFAAQTEEIRAQRGEQIRSVVSKTATGSGDIDETFELDERFRLVFVRCHFVGTAGTDAFAISLDSTAGPSYDALLFTVSQAGTSTDVNLRIEPTGAGEPSPWTLQAGDKVRVQWTNPDSGNITWGLEVGPALAS